MSEAARSVPASRPSTNPYAARARLVREVRARLDAGVDRPADPFAGVEDAPSLAMPRPSAMLRADFTLGELLGGAS